MALTIGSCREEYSPKPYGYYRIDFPEKDYQPLIEDFPYHFQIAAEATIETDKESDAEPYWINIYYPAYNARIHLSYKKIDNDSALIHYQEDCHRMAYSHTIKAESINERFLQHDDVYGLIYLIEGNTASSTQFFVTDSVKHFLRGSLYFNVRPNKDSLAPVINYLREDIVNLMETITFSPPRNTK